MANLEITETELRKAPLPMLRTLAGLIDRERGRIFVRNDEADSPLFLSVVQLEARVHTEIHSRVGHMIRRRV